MVDEGGCRDDLAGPVLQGHGRNLLSEGNKAR